MLITLTFYQHFTKYKDEEIMFDELRVKFRSKRIGRREKLLIKQMCVSSQKIRMRKEEGATATASHLPSLSWLLSGRTGSVLPRTPTKQWERVINYLKCPTNETPAIFRHLIDSPKQMTNETKMQLSLRTD